MKLKVIETYNDKQLSKLMKLDEIVEVKTKKRAEELIAAGVARPVEEEETDAEA